MNVNDLVDAFGLPRNYAEKMPPGTSVVATIQPDGAVKVAIHAPQGLSPDQARFLAHDLSQPVSEPAVIEQKRGPGRPRKVLSE